MFDEEKTNIFSQLLQIQENDNTDQNTNVDKFSSEDISIESLLAETDKPFSKITNDEEIKKVVHLNAGHRQRVRDKLLSIKDTSVFHDYEILEMMLFYIPRIDVKQMAKQIMNRFGTLKNAINSDFEEIKILFGQNRAETIYFIFKLFKEASIRSTEFIDQNIYDQKKIIEFITQKIGHLRTEHCLAMFFNKKKQLIQYAIESEGSVDEITVYSRNIIKHAISLNSSYLCLAHNHPSGNVDPSAEDMIFTEELKRLSAGLNIKILDHVIISEAKVFSFIDNQLL